MSVQSWTAETDIDAVWRHLFTNRTDIPSSTETVEDPLQSSTRESRITGPDELLLGGRHVLKLGEIPPSMMAFWAVAIAGTVAPLSQRIVPMMCATIVLADWLESSSSLDPKSPLERTVVAEIERSFAAARSEVFEDGMESEFSRHLVRLVDRFGNIAVRGIGAMIPEGNTNPEVVGEALRWLGLMEDPSTYRNRLRVLERSLQSPHVQVRDGAGLGLAALDDPEAIPYLEQAIEREQDLEMLQDLTQVLRQLRDTRAGTVQCRLF